MQNTVQLYYEDATLTEFHAEVRELRSSADGLDVVLDRTAFYPEGGGQPADKGQIADARVLDVRKEAGEILHRVESVTGLAVGQQVVCRLDTERRRDYMQQHTAQHIISGALYELGGHATVAVHLGTEYLTVEVDRENISDIDIELVEQRANQIIEANLPLTTIWVTDHELASYPLRRRPKLSGKIRLVMIGDFDCVACGGVHVGRTGEVRLIHNIGVERIRGRVRSIWKAGDRALADYRQSSAIVQKLVEEFSAPAPGLVTQIRARLHEQTELARRLGLMERRLAHETARSLTNRAAGEQAGGVVTAAYEDEPKGFLRQVGEALISEAGVAACLTNRRAETIEWCIAVSPDREFDFDAFRPELLRIIAGKGGGRRPIWQGAGTHAYAGPELLAAFRAWQGS